MIDTSKDGIVYFDGKRIRANDPARRYIRDYYRIFRDGGRFYIPEDRLVFGPGNVYMPHSLTRLNPGRTTVYIKLIHGGYVSAMYLGDWQEWTRGAWRFRQFYGGTVMTSDEAGPYRIPNDIRGRYLDVIAKILSIDAERPVVYEDIQGLIKPGQERKTPAESVSEIAVQVEAPEDNGHGVI